MSCRGHPPEDADAGISFVSYGGTANVKKCSAWTVKSIWKRDFQPHQQASVFETIYEVSHDLLKVFFVVMSKNLSAYTPHGACVLTCCCILCCAHPVVPHIHGAIQECPTSALQRGLSRYMPVRAAGDSCHASGEPSGSIEHDTWSHSSVPV